MSSASAALPPPLLRPPPTPTPASTSHSNIAAFLLSSVVLAYLFTFVVFAVLRVVTGISIQRLGYLSLKHIVLELGDHAKLEIRTLGLLLHRPTFSQPTWISLVVQDSHLTIDLREKSAEHEGADDDEAGENTADGGGCGCGGGGEGGGGGGGGRGGREERGGGRGREGGERGGEGGGGGEGEGGGEGRGGRECKTGRKANTVVEYVRRLKESLKKLHKWIKWIRLVDIVVTNTTVTIADVGSIQIGSLTMTVDTRRGAANRNPMFDHCTDLGDGQWPIEWIFLTKSVVFLNDKKEPAELLDHGMCNVYGVVEQGMAGGIRDLAIAVKFGHVTLPWDELLNYAERLKYVRKSGATEEAPVPFAAAAAAGGMSPSLGSVMEAMAIPSSRAQRMTQVVMESKELLYSILRGVKEVQYAIGHLVIAKDIPSIQSAGRPLQIVLGMKELGMDIHQLDQKSPAHRMYFAPNDIAHQALLAATSITVSLNDGVGQDKILYIPMVTMTSRTTLFSKTIQIMESLESDRNANILSANIVVTSPSIDLQPRHLPLIVALLQPKSGPSPSPSPSPSPPAAQRTHLISRLLPKASVKISIQEPVMRIVLPPSESDPQDLDMLISSLSSISADVEASHDAEGQSRYSLDSAFRLTSHSLYYRAASGMRHDLLETETFDLKAQLYASPEVQVIVNAYLSSLSLRLTRPEIVRGIEQMVSHLHHDYKIDRLRRRRRRHHHRESPGQPNFLRKMPLWLENFKLECNDFGIEVAGLDEAISPATRGAALQVDNWTIEYKSKKRDDSHHPPPPPRRRAASRSLSRDDAKRSGPLHAEAPCKNNATDGRRLSLHIRGLDGFIVDASDSWEQDPFLQIPHFDLALATNNGPEGPILNVSSSSKSLCFNYSLYRHYSVIVAAQVLRQAFGGLTRTAKKGALDINCGDMDLSESPTCETATEFVNIDVRIQSVRIKASMPEDPAMMIEIHQLDAGRHRWGFPFLKAKHFRLYAESPKVAKCWARLVSLRHFRLDLREAKKRSGRKVLDEPSIDLLADAIRLAIPHQLILYKITGNIINTLKALQQMHHRFKTGTDEYILDKVPEGPKIVPKVSLKTKALLLELEDDPFETQLGIIYRVGLSEQKKRLAREAAFEAKVQKMEERGRSKSGETSRTDSDYNNHKSSNHKSKSGPKIMRYDPESAAGPTDNACVTKEEAWEKLQEHNSVAWIKSIRSAKKQHRSRMSEAREMFWGPDEMPTESTGHETVLGLPPRPALMAAFFNDVAIAVDKPSFPLSELPKFLHRVGKGLPEDTLFALLVPVSIKLSFSEAKVLLRDYPLPFIHIPHTRAGQRGHSWSLQADFVLAEELRGAESMRHAQVNIIPAQGLRQPEYSIDVRRTVSPVKSYSDVKVSINTSYATRITWCTAYQPAIQDMMMVFETFTKPHVDPSERTGFWDKIRLILHSQITLAWEGDGDVHLTLKGSRDPYKLTGDGAGFVMCWRGDVQWDLGRDDDPRKFVRVDSEEYLLAIPDFTNLITDDLERGGLPDSRSIISAHSYEKNIVQFKKVIMKLSGRVRWLVGLMFEQEISSDEDWKQRKRSFDFVPHYRVTLKSPEFAKAPPGMVYDAFRGFRSHHLHLSLSIVSPIERDWAPSSTTPSTSYNTIHLTPKFFTHFFSWWTLFSGVMSLPIRQGALWPGPEKSNKKFGRHLATIKYKLCLSPLFISHIYKYHDKDEAGDSIVTATGLKARLDTLLLDIHQRREESLLIPKSTTMKMNQAEIDFHSADIRAVHAVAPSDTLEEILSQTSDGIEYLPETIRYTGDMSQFTISDGDYSWIDMDDFVELDWGTQRTKTPKTSITPLAYAPRFTYFRQTDHAGAPSPLTPFGNEPSHDCIMSLNSDPREIQCALVQSRLERVNQQMSRNREAIDRLAQLTRQNPDDMSLRADSEKLIRQSSTLFNMREFLQAMLRRISSKLDDDGDGEGEHACDENGSEDNSSHGPGIDGLACTDYASDFDNRFIVHNMQAKWSNPLRNIILKYIHQVGQRRGFIYYMSRRAIKFISDMIDDQGLYPSSGYHSHQPTSRAESSPAGPLGTDGLDDSATLAQRIEKLLNDEIKVVVADDRVGCGITHIAKHAGDDLKGDVAEEYVPQNSYHVRLIAPQIQLQSEKNKRAAVLVAAQGMQLKIVSIMDRDRLGDEVSGLVQRRFALNLDNTQFFVSHHQDFVPQSMSLHSENRYGAPIGSSWPPWVPLESMFDFRQTPVGFSRVVERTSAKLRYYKHNSLRLKYSDQVSGSEAGESAASKNGPLETERRIDHVCVDFPRVEATCDSNQYFAMYIIVMDLLLYSEPAEKVRSEKLEKIMLASDFSDLTGAPEMVGCLQNKIRQLAEIQSHFMLNARSLDCEGWKGKLSVEAELANCEEDLFYLMKAITTAQRKFEDRNANADGGLVRWSITASEIIWHMLREQSDPLMDVRLEKAAYERIDNVDGSNLNTFEVEMLQGYNLLPNATYPEMIGRFIDPTQASAEIRHAKVLRVYWNMLEAIAGIPVMDHFEVNLFPLKIQLEREIGDKVFEYIFPDSGKNSSASGSSPYLVRSMKPLPDEFESDHSDIHLVDDSSSARSDVSAGIELRLRPTLSLTQEHRRPKSSGSELARPKTSSATSFLTYRSSRIQGATKSTGDAVSLMARRSTDGPAPSLLVPEKGKKMQLFGRSLSHDRATEQQSDELSQMMSRASNYMSLAYIKIPSVVLCLSYKGRGDKNFEDVHELVFRMPMLEYRNRTWSNLDLAMRLKKDIIRALISHTGAIIQNKFTHHRPERPPQGNALRMKANTSRPGTSLGGSRRESLSPPRPATAIPKSGNTSSSSISGLNVSSASSFSRLEDTADTDGRSGGGFANSLSRHFSNLSSMSKHKDTQDSSEESVKKKGRILLGKKVFGGH